eukprot:CAMPEP_0178912856 /NCGR_PEP_ID=MMETSP0786-20121207/10507_1 /TAXON_ID=186022 /ORGANISM="Thalassionema frauenfeldii, Strain CCMP 1798" /LENGTH=519 /DNA_ID=CAMNT_0020585509 /DNA_START=193 /DNA_END=1752 /DNA_ORIENTATION=+
MATSFCITHLDVSSRARGLVQRSAKSNSQNQNKLTGLYKKVAEQDPEWYKEFVTDILKDESLLPSSLLTQEESDTNEDSEVANAHTPSLKETSLKEKVHSINADENSALESNILKANDVEDKSALEERTTEMHSRDNTTLVDKSKEVSKEARSYTKCDELIAMATLNDTIDDSSVSANEIHNATPKTDPNTSTKESDKSRKIQKLSEEAPCKTKEENKIKSGKFGGTNITGEAIIYRDLSTNRLKMTSVQFLAELGYDLQVDIPVLKADVIAMIIEDKMQKPVRGIPLYWKITPDQNHASEGGVQIVSKDEAEQLLQLESDHRAPEIDDMDKARDITPLRKGDSKEEGAPGKNMRVKRNSDKIRLKQNESDQRGDPPPPPGPLWVDIDTFRGLLRRENEFRINILGDDWKDTVKMEGKWRLGLYKQWLWALNNGRDKGVISTRLPPRSSSTTSPSIIGSTRSRVRRKEPAVRRPILDPRNPPRYRSPERNAIRRQNIAGIRGSNGTGRKRLNTNDEQRE